MIYPTNSSWLQHLKFKNLLFFNAMINLISIVFGVLVRQHTQSGNLWGIDRLIDTENNQ